MERVSGSGRSVHANNPPGKIQTQFDRAKREDASVSDNMASLIGAYFIV
jgi:hypothetical protein